MLAYPFCIPPGERFERCGDFGLHEISTRVDQCVEEQTGRQVRRCISLPSRAIFICLFGYKFSEMCL